MLIGWILGCVGPTTVEVPGGLVSDPIWPEWPADVPSLAGCTWIETPTTPASPVSWIYNDQGKLISKQEGSTVTTYSWRRGCLSGLTIETGTSSELYLYSCDDRDNPVVNDHYMLDDRGELIPLDETRTFVNSYDALGQLAMVETWTESTADFGPRMVDTYTWNGEQQPVVQVHEEPLDGVKITTTWWWDHELLLGRDEEGTGEDAFMERTYEDRRLVEEVVSSDVSETLTTNWEYAERPGRFPVYQTVFDGGVVESEISVLCQEVE